MEQSAIILNYGCAQVNKCKGRFWRHDLSYNSPQNHSSNHKILNPCFRSVIIHLSNPIVAKVGSYQLLAPYIHTSFCVTPKFTLGHSALYTLLPLIPYSVLVTYDLIGSKLEFKQLKRNMNRYFYCE